MSKPPVAKDFFLPEQKNADDRFYLGPIRSARGITSIVDGDAIFRALEEAIVGAKKSVLVAFWALDTQLYLRSDAAKKSGKIWADLLIEKAKKGVLVRLLWNDFDPAFQNDNHTVAWLRYGVIVRRAVSEGVSTANFQVVCARHEAEVTAKGVKDAFQAGAYDKLIKSLEYGASDPARSDPDEMKKKRILAYVNGPGLWDKIDFNEKTISMSARKSGEAYPASPAAYHQKYVIVDGQVGFAGGINIVAPNLDNRKHTLIPDWAWHDAFVRVEGEPIEDMTRNFIGIWNFERGRTEKFITEALKQANLKNLPMPVGATTDLTLNDVKPAAPDKSKTPIPSQIQRTMTKRGTADNGVPTIVRKDVLDGYVRAIGLAEKYIYIENQYFREKEIADAIVAQHKKNKDLRTIVLLPKVAEEFMKSKGDPISLYGAALQFELFETMKKEIGKNLGLFCAVVGGKETVVYIHSKLILIDDVYANLGSANANPRSFRMDAELNLAWYDKRSVKQLRLNLWNEFLGSAGGISSWKPKDFVDKWSAIAKTNQGLAPKKRKSLVIAFDNVIQGAKLPIIPPEFT